MSAGIIIVWIKCKSGEYLDPKKISSINVLPCYGSCSEVDIFAEYNGHSFLLFRAPLSAMKELGVRHNQEKFQAIISELERKHEESRNISFEDIFRLILCGPAEKIADPP